MSLQANPLEQPGWMEDVRVRLARRARPEPLDETDLKRAAVLLPLFVRKGMLWILLTRRTETVTRAPIFRSFRRMVPQVASASLVLPSPIRRSAHMST